MPAWIVFPTFASDAAARLTRLPRARAFFKLADCSFNYESLGLRGFTTLSRMIDGCDAYEFTYSSLEDAQNLLGALVQLEQAGGDAVAVTVLPDSHKKYLSTDLLRPQVPEPDWLAPHVEFESWRAIACAHA